MKNTLIAGFLIASSISQIHAQVTKPNIIVFYVDDLGHQDVQINELDDPCPYETPNMVALAAAGMNFPQAYSPAPTCSPSRAAILSGRHPAKNRFTHVTLDNRSDARAADPMIAPYLEAQLNRNVLTSADALKANGYRTGHSGKWHIGLNAANYGFETVNHSRGAHRSMSPDRLSDFATTSHPTYPLSVEKYPPISASNPQGVSYPYDEVTESALQFMEDNKDEPFFLNLCHWMVHWPVLTRNEELLEHYCDKFGLTYPDDLRDPVDPVTGEVLDWTTAGQTNPYFAAMVTTVDWSLGRIVDYLEVTDDPRNPGQKLIDTTYIFFSSDNGGAETRGPEIISDNAPYKGKKGNVEGGGIRVPMVISGPGIAAGTEFNTMVNQLDFFPTFLELTDTTISAADTAELSGLDISPVLLDPTPGDAQVLDAMGNEREFLFWHFPHGEMDAAIRSGDYKLHKQFESTTYELYRLYDANGDRLDIEEVNDLGTDLAYASIVTDLSGKLEAALLANNAEPPYLNPNHTGVDPATVAAVDTSLFAVSTRLAELAIDTSRPKIVDAYIIYTDGPTTSGDTDVVTEDAISGMREAATLSADGYSVSAVIPASITAYAFMLIDENGFMQYTTPNGNLDSVQTALIEDDFTESAVSTGSRFVSDDISSGDWVTRSTSGPAWAVSGGQLTNPATTTLDEQGTFLLNSVNISDPSFTQVMVSFDYDVGAGSTLFFHSTLFTGGTTTSGNMSRISQTGGGYFAVGGNDFNPNFGSALNLKDGAVATGSAVNAVASFAGNTSGTFTQTYDISDYAGIDSVLDVSHILAAFAADTAAAGNGTITIDNVNITAVAPALPTTGLLEKPIISVTTVDSIDYLTVSYTPEAGSTKTYTVEVSTDLDMWEDGVMNVDFFDVLGSPVDNGEGTMTFHLRYKDNIDDETKLFIRLLAESN
ncbi:sulfatase-like hydrolase/transferase [Akkermansiaceae bacterium]|nr:sulfatase-like hydrolase/transferase [Akkermansiaceae bacterium]